MWGPGSNPEQVQTGYLQSNHRIHPTATEATFKKKKITTRKPLESGLKELKFYLQLFLLLNKQKKMATVVPVMTL